MSDQGVAPFRRGPDPPRLVRERDPSFRFRTRSVGGAPPPRIHSRAGQTYVRAPISCLTKPMLTARSTPAAARRVGRGTSSPAVTSQLAPQRNRRSTQESRWGHGAFGRGLPVRPFTGEQLIGPVTRFVRECCTRVPLRSSHRRAGPHRDASAAGRPCLTPTMSVRADLPGTTGNQRFSATAFQRESYVRVQSRSRVLVGAVVGGLALGTYEIARRLQEHPGLMVLEGTIYPLMSRLEKEGLVTSSLEPSPEGPARKYYELSRDGGAALGRINAGWDDIVAAVEALRGAD